MKSGRKGKIFGRTTAKGGVLYKYQEESFAKLLFKIAELVSDLIELPVELSVAGWGLEKVELLVSHKIMEIGVVFKHGKSIPVEVCKKEGKEKKEGN